MKNWAIGWACNLNDLFVRFPYEKYKTFRNWTKVKKLQLVKRIFTESVKIIMNDIIENNVSFKLPSLGYRGGEIHMEGVRDSEFERARKNGKFKNVDFLESMFTGYQMYLYIHGKRDNFIHSRKFPIYLSKYYRYKLTKNTNEGKQYC